MRSRCLTSTQQNTHFFLAPEHRKAIFLPFSVRAHLAKGQFLDFPLIKFAGITAKTAQLRF